MSDPSGEHHGLELDGALQIERGHSRCRVTGQGEALVIEMDSLSDALALWRTAPAPAAKQARTRRLALADQALKHAGLTLDLRVAGRTVGKLGARARPRRIPLLPWSSWVELRVAPFLHVALAGVVTSRRAA